MKKILIAILVLSMLLSFVACSNGTEPIDTSDTSSDATAEPTAADTTVPATEETSAQTSAQSSEETSEETSAETDPPAPTKVKVAIFTDPHSALIDTKVNTRRPSLSPVKIKKMMDRFEQMGVEYVLCQIGRAHV